MVFSSMTFVVFFLPIVILLYFICKNQHYRNGVLLVASLLFYSWGEPKWIFAMLFTVTVNYLCAVLIDRTDGQKLKRLWLFIGVAVSLGFLFYFKYSGFVMDSVTGLFGVDNPFKAPVLPIGISFYTFQVLTYTVDVYYGKVKLQKNYAKLLLYVSFFPQLIAGPIVNYKDIERYLGKRKITLNNFYQGFMRFLIGFSKKILLANTCGEITAELTKAGEFSVAGAWLLAIAYTFQIYFDFSGYSDMAIGIGRMFGFKFLENFRYPYLSDSITEFWRRWHISLGSFFRDYVYIPLGGNRVGKARMILNTMIVWMLTGIWHGASWNFLVWGFYYGVLLILEKFIFKKIKAKIPLIVNIAFTMFLVVIGWVFFYYTDLTDGLKHLGIMFGLVETKLTDAYAIYYFKHYLGFLIAALLACFPWKTFFESIFEKHKDTVNRIEMLLKPVIVTALFVVSFSMLVGQSYNPFLYFRF